MAHYKNSGRTGHDELEVLLNEFLDLRTSLRNTQRFLDERDTSADSRFRMEKDSENIKFYLAQMQDINSLEQQGADKLRKFISDIHDIIRRNPATVKHEPIQVEEADVDEDLYDRSPPRSPSPTDGCSSNTGPKVIPVEKVSSITDRGYQMCFNSAQQSQIPALFNFGMDVDMRNMNNQFIESKLESTERKSVQIPCSSNMSTNPRQRSYEPRSSAEHLYSNPQEYVPPFVRDQNRHWNTRTSAEETNINARQQSSQYNYFKNKRGLELSDRRPTEEQYVRRLNEGSQESRGSYYRESNSGNAHDRRRQDQGQNSYEYNRSRRNDTAYGQAFKDSLLRDGTYLHNEPVERSRGQADTYNRNVDFFGSRPPEKFSRNLPDSQSSNRTQQPNQRDPRLSINSEQGSCKGRSNMGAPVPENVPTQERFIANGFIQCFPTNQPPRHVSPVRSPVPTTSSRPSASNLNSNVPPSRANCEFLRGTPLSAHGKDLETSQIAQILHRQKQVFNQSSKFSHRPQQSLQVVKSEGSSSSSGTIINRDSTLLASNQIRATPRAANVKNPIRTIQPTEMQSQEQSSSKKVAEQSSREIPKSKDKESVNTGTTRHGSCRTSAESTKPCLTKAQEIKRQLQKDTSQCFILGRKSQSQHSMSFEDALNTQGSESSTLGDSGTEKETSSPTVKSKRRGKRSKSEDAKKQNMEHKNDKASSGISKQRKTKRASSKNEVCDDAEAKSDKKEHKRNIRGKRKRVTRAHTIAKRRRSCKVSTSLSESEALSLVEEPVPATYSSNSSRSPSPIICTLSPPASPSPSPPSISHTLEGNETEETKRPSKSNIEVVNVRDSSDEETRISTDTSALLPETKKTEESATVSNTTDGSTGSNPLEMLRAVIRSSFGDQMANDLSQDKIQELLSVLNKNCEDIQKTTEDAPGNNEGQEKTQNDTSSAKECSKRRSHCQRELASIQAALIECNWMSNLPVGPRRCAIKESSTEVLSVDLPSASSAEGAAGTSSTRKTVRQPKVIFPREHLLTNVVEMASSHRVPEHELEEQDSLIGQLPDASSEKNDSENLEMDKNLSTKRGRAKRSKREELTDEVKDTNNEDNTKVLKEPRTRKSSPRKFGVVEPSAIDNESSERRVTRSSARLKGSNVANSTEITPPPQPSGLITEESVEVIEAQSQVEVILLDTVNNEEKNDVSPDEKDGDLSIEPLHIVESSDVFVGASEASPAVDAMDTGHEFEVDSNLSPPTEILDFNKITKIIDDSLVCGDVEHSDEEPCKKKFKPSESCFNNSHDELPRCQECDILCNDIIEHYVNYHRNISTIPLVCLPLRKYTCLLEHYDCTPQLVDVGFVNSLWECIYCCEKIDDSQKYFEHLSAHTGEFLYQCNECDFRFPTEKSLHNHLSIVHHFNSSNFPRSKKIFQPHIVDDDCNRSKFNSFLCTECLYFQLRMENLSLHRLENKHHCSQSVMCVSFSGPTNVLKVECPELPKTSQQVAIEEVLLESDPAAMNELLEKADSLQLGSDITVNVFRCDSDLYSRILKCSNTQNEEPKVCYNRSNDEEIFAECSSLLRTLVDHVDSYFDNNIGFGDERDFPDIISVLSTEESSSLDVENGFEDDRDDWSYTDDMSDIEGEVDVVTYRAVKEMLDDAESMVAGDNEMYEEHKYIPIQKSNFDGIRDVEHGFLVNNSHLITSVDDCAVRKIYNKSLVRVPRPGDYYDRICLLQRGPNDAKEADIMELMKGKICDPASGCRRVAFKQKNVYEAMLSPDCIKQFYKCMGTHCSFTTDDISDFKLHFNNHAFEISSTRCMSYDFVMNKNYLSCTYCNLEFSTVEYLCDHLLRQHGKSRYQCGYCFYRCVSKQSISLHMETTHYSRAVDYFEVDSQSVDWYYDDSSFLDVKTFECCEDDCGMKFMYRDQFRDHMKTTHEKSEYICSYCTADEAVPMGPDPLITHCISHHLFKYQCLYCLFGTEIHDDIEHHLSSLHPGLEHRVLNRMSASLNSPDDDIYDPRRDDNDVSISTPAPSSTAEDSECNDNPFYRCGNSSCNFSTLCLQTFKEHISACRTPGTKGFACFHCGKRTKTMPSFLEHIKVHKNKNHRKLCSLCSFNTWINSDMVKHLKTEHHVSNYKLIHAFGGDDGDMVAYPKEVAQRHISPEDLERDRMFYEPKMQYFPGDEEKVPPRAIFASLLHCGLCSFSSKIRSNFIRHLNLHRLADEGIGTLSVPHVGPVNVVAPLDKKDSMFEKMTNWAASSHEDKSTGRVSSADAEKLPKFVDDQFRYRCSVSGCSQITVDAIMLLTHMKALHSDVDIYVCPHCWEDSSTKYNPRYIVPIDKLGSHLKLHGRRLYQCGHCDYIQVVARIMEKHITEKHPEKKPIHYQIRNLGDEGESARRNSVDDAQKDQGEKWRCAICMVKLYGWDEASSHCRTVHGVPHQFSCSICWFSSNSVQEVSNHVRKQQCDKDNMLSEKSANLKCDLQIYFFRQEALNASELQEEEPSNIPIWKQNRIKHIRGMFLEESPKPKASGNAAQPAKNAVNSKREYEDMPVLTPAVTPPKAASPSKTSKHDDAPIVTASSEVLMYCPKCTLYKTRKCDELITHIYNELKYTRYECVICPHKFITEVSIRAHVVYDHKEDYDENKRILSPVNEEFEQYTLDAVNRQLVTLKVSNDGTPDEGHLICRHCYAKFSNYHNFRTHLLAKHLASERFKCEYCSGTFWNEGLTKLHHSKSNHAHLPLKITEDPDLKNKFTDEFWSSQYGLPKSTKKPVVVKSLVASRPRPMRTSQGTKSQGTKLQPTKQQSIKPQPIKPQPTRQLSIKSQSTKLRPVKSQPIKPKKKVLTCAHCAYTTTNARMMLEHCEDFHEDHRKSYPKHNEDTVDDFSASPPSINNETTTSRSPVKQADTPESRALVYKCYYCGEKLFTSRGLRQHWIRSHADTEEDCRYFEYKSFAGKDNLQLQEGISLTCAYCQFFTHSSAELRSHHNEAHPAKLFKLKRKNTTSGADDSFDSEIKAKFVQDLPLYKCGLCEVENESKVVANEHAKEIHHGAKAAKPIIRFARTVLADNVGLDFTSPISNRSVYKCPKCSYTNLDKNSLIENHLIEHSKPFVCPICDDDGYAFYGEFVDTERHIKNVHYDYIGRPESNPEFSDLIQCIQLITEERLPAKYRSPTKNQRCYPSASSKFAAQGEVSSVNENIQTQDEQNNSVVTKESLNNTFMQMEPSQLKQPIVYRGPRNMVSSPPQPSIQSLGSVMSVKTAPKKMPALSQPSLQTVQNSTLTIQAVTKKIPTVAKAPIEMVSTVVPAKTTAKRISAQSLHLPRQVVSTTVVPKTVATKRASVPLIQSPVRITANSVFAAHTVTNRASVPSIQPPMQITPNSVFAGHMVTKRASVPSVQFQPIALNSIVPARTVINKTSVSSIQPQIQVAPNAVVRAQLIAKRVSAIPIQSPMQIVSNTIVPAQRVAKRISAPSLQSPMQIPPNASGPSKTVGKRISAPSLQFPMQMSTNSVIPGKTVKKRNSVPLQLADKYGVPAKTIAVKRVIDPELSLSDDTAARLSRLSSSITIVRSPSAAPSSSSTSSNTSYRRVSADPVLGAASNNEDDDDDDDVQIIGSSFQVPKFGSSLGSQSSTSGRSLHVSEQGPTRFRRNENRSDTITQENMSVSTSDSNPTTLLLVPIPTQNYRGVSVHPLIQQALVPSPNAELGNTIVVRTYLIPQYPVPHTGNSLVSPELPNHVDNTGNNLSFSTLQSTLVNNSCQVASSPAQVVLREVERDDDDEQLQLNIGTSVNATSQVSSSPAQVIVRVVEIDDNDDEVQYIGTVNTSLPVASSPAQLIVRAVEIDDNDDEVQYIGTVNTSLPVASSLDQLD